MIKKITKSLFTPFFIQLNKPEYLKQIERAYKAGYTYHQKLIQNNSELLNWILKENYYDE